MYDSTEHPSLHNGWSPLDSVITVLYMNEVKHLSLQDVVMDAVFILRDCDIITETSRNSVSVGKFQNSTGGRTDTMT